jgi:hypothetical protein
MMAAAAPAGKKRNRRSWLERWRERREEKPTADGKYRRVYNPIPRSALYIAGTALVAVLLSPFWVYLIQERYKSNRVFLSEETTNIVVSATTNATTPLFNPNERPPVLFDQYRGVRLDTGRDDLQRRFSMRLQNTRGMEPEIYMAQKVGDLEQLTAYFYGGLLKEAFLVLPEHRAHPNEVLRGMVEQFGNPVSMNDNQNRAVAPGLGLPGIGGGDAGDDLSRKLAGYPWRRDVAWADAQFRVEATIYFTSPDPSLCQSLPVVHLVAAGWLKANQSMREVITPATRGTEGKGSLLPPPKSLF